jgi:hypothetical protein
VDCYVFVGTNATAFTTEYTGDNLPLDRGPWRYVRKVGDRELRRSEEAEVMRGLRADGFAIVNG